MKIIKKILKKMKNYSEKHNQDIFEYKEKQKKYVKF